MSEKINENMSLAPEVQDAINYIQMMKQECATLGNNDSEFDLLEQLATAVKSGDIEPAIAKEKAIAIRSGKIER
ncbi:hypothetical protein KKH39_00125 [Patescibacteria group bacterium]|nr:hypothetical protein [Patescibacteria group bacterium]